MVLASENGYIGGMKTRHLSPVISVFVAVTCALGQVSTISPYEAKSMVRVVLRHEKIDLSSPYCSLEGDGGGSKPFVPGYYTFFASCDYPNTGATTVFGLYVVSPRTGDVLEPDLCRWFRFPELRRLQRKIMRRTHASDLDEAKFRKRTDCAESWRSQ